MQFNALQPVHRRKRATIIGRGGKRGKTSGRGGKGQTARAGHKVRPELRDVIMRVPKLRGRGTNVLKSLRPHAVPIPVHILERFFDAGAEVTPAALVAKGLLERRSGKIPPVKILGGEGTCTKPFRISGCGVSLSAKRVIEAAGGTVKTA